MTSIERRVTQSGLLLFFLGLPLGFLIHSLPNQRVALSAHLNAVQSGTALIVLGLIAPRLALSPRVATILATTLSLSFWGLELRILASALALPAQGPLARAAGLLGALSALGMLLAVGAMVVLHWTSTRRRTDPVVTLPRASALRAGAG